MSGAGLPFDDGAARRCRLPIRPYFWCDVAARRNARARASQDLPNLNRQERNWSAGPVAWLEGFDLSGLHAGSPDRGSAHAKNGACRWRDTRPCLSLSLRWPATRVQCDPQNEGTARVFAPLKPTRMRLCVVRAAGQHWTSRNECWTFAASGLRHGVNHICRGDCMPLNHAGARRPALQLASQGLACVHDGQKPVGELILFGAELRATHDSFVQGLHLICIAHPRIG